jgi:membrane protein YdbS with pleckstrin-like domain
MSIDSAFHLKDREKVVRIVRRTPLVTLPALIVAFAFIGMPFFFMIPLLSHKGWGASVFAASFVIGLVLAWRAYVIWHWNAFVITDLRVIDVDQRGFFERVVSDAPYEKIQDVSYAVRGIWGTIFDFGTIVIQTAGATVNLELPHVRRPRDVHHLITGLAAARTPGSVPTTRTDKVATLLDAASELNEAEARAFLTTLQQAIAEKPSDED